MKKLFFILISLSVNIVLSAQIPATPIAEYPLNINANDFSSNAYNGTLTSTTNTTNRFGTASKAQAFTASVSTGTLPLALATAMQNDFSLGYWFKTNMVASSSSQWYGGNAMVDAEVCGATNDWGTALIDGGKVCFGIGNTDITIKSSSSTYNDGAWHFVTVTRNKTAGTIILYVDGAQVATTAGTNTGILNAPNLVGLGRNPCAVGGVFTGSLDDIIAYNRVLSAAEITNLYTFLNAAVLPLQWVSFTGSINGGKTTLQWEVTNAINNNYFEIEQSADGMHFAVAGTVQNNEGVSHAPGNLSYTFSVAALSGSVVYYRLKQADLDGKYALSKTIRLAPRNSVAGLYLQVNPVTDELVLVNSRQILIKRLVVTDMSGRIVSDAAINSNSWVIRSATRNLLPGYYLLRISGADGNSSLPLIKK